MKKVLVTGGSGFIGSHCLQILSSCADYEVHATCHCGKTQEIDNVTWHPVNLMAPGAAAALLAKIKPTHLLHMAWYAVPGKFWSASENFMWVAASLSLLQAFAENGGERCVMAGTCAEYDWQYGYCSEMLTPCNPDTVYGTCKHALHSLVDTLCKKEGLSSAWGRIFFLYGPREPSQKLISFLISSLLEKREAQCSHGRQIRDFLYVHDVAQAFITLLSNEVQGEVNISSGNPVSLREIILKIADMLNGLDLVQLGEVPVSKSEPDLLVGNNRRLVEECGWTPRYDLASGLERTVDWWRKQLNP